jgi:hypothetical protein
MGSVLRHITKQLSLFTEKSIDPSLPHLVRHPERLYWYAIIGSETGWSPERPVNGSNTT